METSGLTSIDTQRLAGVSRAANVVWPSSFASAATGGKTSASQAKARQPDDQSAQQSSAAAPSTGLVVRANAAYLAQSLAQDSLSQGSGSTPGGDALASAQAAAAYARVTAASTPPVSALASSGQSGTVEVLAGSQAQSDASRPVDLTV